MRIEPEIRDNATVSRTTYDLAKGETIPAIASFDDKGRIVPLYLRINGTACRVLNYVQKNNSHKVLEYQCDIEDDGMRRWLRIRYCYAEGIWVMVEE